MQAKIHNTKNIDKDEKIEEGKSTENMQVDLDDEKISSTSHKTPVIEIKNVSKTYGKGSTKNQVLKNVSVTIYSKEFVVIFGPSGCGKSTLLNCMSGLEIPDEGSVVVRNYSLKGKDDNDLAIHRRDKIGIVFQQFNLLKEMSIEKNIALPQAFKGAPLKTRTERAHKLLRMFGLGKEAHRRPTELSGGQQQKVAIARALVNNPWIVLADEPTGNLDSKSADEVLNILLNLARKSLRTVIMITHNGDYLQYADRVIFMRDGIITKDEHNKHPKALKLKEEKDDKEEKSKEHKIHKESK